MPVNFFPDTVKSWRFWICSPGGLFPFFCLMKRPAPPSALFPYTTLFRSIFLPATVESRPLNDQLPSVTVTVERSPVVSVELRSVSQTIEMQPNAKPSLGPPFHVMSVNFLPDTVKSWKFSKFRPDWLVPDV